ncbi:MAG: calcium-translocating P-type ATPase, PMCA-type [Prevotella sp.]|nr:calcium-translocating P-type ATPase, PMCA-type [Prevotella sp.]
MSKSQDRNVAGLSSLQVEESRQKYGENTLTPPPQVSAWSLYLDKYRDPIIQILLAAAAVSLLLAFVENDFIETIGIIIAIFLATTIGFCFERDAAKKFDILNALGEEQAVKVRRNGHVIEVPRREIVVGDVVMLAVGDEIPADGTLLWSIDLQVDESSLTGESLAHKSVISRETPADADGIYPPNQLLRSSMVLSGEAEYEVTAVGDATEIGRVARKSTETTDVKTPLNQQLERLASLISKVGAAVAVLAFVCFLTHDILSNPTIWQQHDWLKMAEVVLRYFMMSVTLIVMAVPEGLPMAVTLALALNMRRMLKSNNLVRKLHACETMGAVTVICTDKTGTLTLNQMKAVHYGCDDERALLKEVILNSTAELDGLHGIGNPTEVAMLRDCDAHDLDYRKVRNEGVLLDRHPFTTERKYMASLWNDSDTALYVKGAPEVMFSFCSMTDGERAEKAAEIRRYQQKGMRTLAFAHRRDVSAITLENLSYVGFVAISDPVREDVKQAVCDCRKAGIEVKIVTGDNALTAIEVARQIGIWHENDASHMTGADFMSLSDEEAMQRARALCVMSRARPADKQRLVEVLQKAGEVVAVTGDGTNDAPALHHAHVGLSLGSGTSVAKQASDITLIDDSFGSIAHAVMWGRSLYKNIQRFLFYQLVVNVAALLLVLCGSFVGTELPLTVTQILWVNLIMDTFAALALAALPPSREVMNEQPRSRADFIVTPSMGRSILFCGIAFFLVMFGFLLYCERNGSSGIDLHELTLFFTTFVMLQWWNLFNAKTLGSRHSAFRRLADDRGLLLVLATIMVGQVAIVEWGGSVFRTMPITLREWIVVVLATSVVMWTGEAIRLVKRMLYRNRREAIASSDGILSSSL